MIFFKKKDIVQELIDAHNDTDYLTQQNLTCREYYENLVEKVKSIMKSHKDADLNELRNALYEDSCLDTKLRSFFLYRKKAPGAVISFGTGKHQDKFVIGNKQEVVMNNSDILTSSPISMEEDTIFDLASCTKLFTAVSILQLAGNGQIRLDDMIKKYLPQFSQLGYHTIFDLLTYQPYYTENRIADAKSIYGAEQFLFNAKPYSLEECNNKDRYNDIAPMILKYIIEGVTGMTFEGYVKENILDKVNMNNTFVAVPKEKKTQVANANYLGYIDKDGHFTIKKTVDLGIATDDKAVALGQPIGYLSGHAGLFSSCEDMVSFSRGLINGLILHPALTREMSKNRTFSLVRTNNGIEYYPTYGFLCNSKNPNPLFTEVFHPLSGTSFSQSGWSGTHVTIDPVNDINLSFMSNRTHNRIVSIDGHHNIFTNINGSRFATDDNGNTMLDSSIYGYEKRVIINACLELALEEKILEEIVGKQIDKEKEKVKVRRIQ